MPNRELFTGANVLHPDGTIAPAEVLIEDGTIAGVEPSIHPPEAAEVADLTGLTLVPGFIDLHVHGGGGFSLITGEVSAVEGLSGWVTRTGVTGFLATIVGDSLENGIACVTTARRAHTDGAAVVGVNLEGPFVSPERPGALPRAWLQPPDVDTLSRLIDAAAGALRMMTVAPELPGAEKVIRQVIDAGAVVSIGHTDATYEQARSAFEWGSRHVTHAFNAMRPLHHREPGPLAAALEFPEVTVEVIADGVHLHPATVRLLVEAFGPDRVCLVTDAVAPAGLGAGNFRIGEHEARLEDGSIRLPDGTLAGSALTMDQAVRNIVDWGIADLPAAVRMASTTPARVLGKQNHLGAVATGYAADLVGLTEDLRVVKTWVGGRLVYDRH